MKRTMKKNLVALTLIEMLVVVAIIGITSSIVLVDWSGNRTVRYLDNAAQEVEGVVRSAQNSALTGAQGVVGTQPCRFRVSWGGSTYSILYYYKDGSGMCNQTSPLGSYTLTSGVTFSSVGNFEFTVPHATVSANQTILLTKLGVRHVVCVYTSGRVDHVAGATCP